MTPDDPIKQALTLLMLSCGDKERPGIEDTPGRFIKALREMTSGYHEDPSEHLRTYFDIKDMPGEGGYHGMIVSRDVEFVSLCEHHLLAFDGQIHMAYIPKEAGKVVGLSKLARMADGYARRFQVQERLTEQILNAMVSMLQPKGAIVVIKARHTCQCFRGVKKEGAMVTSCLYGVFNESGPRAEFMSFLTL